MSAAEKLRDVAFRMRACAMCNHVQEIDDIAATLESEQPPVDKLIRCLENDYGITARWDGLRKVWLTERATPGRGTCEPNWVLQGKTQTQEFWRCECGNCGECFGVESRESFPFKMTVGKVDIPNYCPNCGAKK